MATTIKTRRFRRKKETVLRTTYIIDIWRMSVQDVINEISGLTLYPGACVSGVELRGWATEIAQTPQPGCTIAYLCCLNVAPDTPLTHLVSALAEVPPEIRLLDQQLEIHTEHVETPQEIAARQQQRTLAAQRAQELRARTRLERLNKELEKLQAQKAKLLTEIPHE